MSDSKNKIFLVLGYILALTGIFFKIYSITSSITNSPFTTFWSEGGRIFAAYQVYAPIIDGKYLSWPWLDPGRSIFDGIVLLIPNLPIWAYRIWLSILFLIFSFLAALFTIRKAFVFSQTPDKRKKEIIVPLTLWGMLFLLQGPVYYHILAGVLPVLWFYDEKRPVRNLIIIIFCSMWQGLCRVNWFIMPAAVAVLLHVLRAPFPRNAFWKYIKWPLVYSASSGISSFTIYLIYIKAMGYVIPFLNPNMKYFFFRYKLWPNAGFMGLIPGIVLLTLPTLLVILYVVWKYRRKLHWLRLAIIMCILGIFFAGSTVISLRAGGGYDLHNYDSVFLLLFISACFFGMDAVYLDRTGQLEKPLLTNYGVLVLILIIPILVASPKTFTIANKTTAQSEQTLQEIKQVLQELTDTNADHPILFIDQRQLLVFHMIEDENIYVPYEKIELMEMAMANNRDYRSQFVSDLENQRFSLIVSEILPTWEKPFELPIVDPYWYENNAWVDFVSTPVLNYYTPIYINDIGIAIYAPKE